MSRVPLLLLAAAVGCAPAAPPPAPPPAVQTIPAPPALPPGVSVAFEDVAAPMGVDFSHACVQGSRRWIMQSTGGGVAWLDYDRDGWPDLFFVGGGPCRPDDATPLQPCRLYRNLGGKRFEPVADSGLGAVGCGQGCAAGDVDGDGYPDLFVTAYGAPNRFYRNVAAPGGGRRFEEATAAAGLPTSAERDGRPNWGTCCAFLDYDRDGRPDLFVGSYIRVDLPRYPKCVSRVTGIEGVCPPSDFDGTTCSLYRNEGGGRFRDVSREAGVDAPNAKALGVVALDLDDNGWTDLFVANDGVPNFLFLNNGGKFREAGPASGCAVNLAGTPQAYMGVDAEDVTGDGRPDLYATAFARETDSLWRNEGGGYFLDATQGSGVGPPSWYPLAFGCAFADVDRDGNPDVAVVNGHVAAWIDAEGDPKNTFRQPAQLYRGEGNGRFREVSALAGPYFSQPRVGRGLAVADFDNDGRPDFAVGNSGGQAALLRNVGSDPNHWIRLELRGAGGDPDAVGAKVTVRAGAATLVRHRKGGGSYFAAHDPRLLIGLGTAARAESVEVRWPSGKVQAFGPLEAGRGYLLAEGAAAPEARP